MENYGLDKIEIRDNGEGIPSSSIPLVAKRHHTSKIATVSDIEAVSTYGFRGEAVGSLCTVSSLSITSKTKHDDVGQTFTFDHHGNVTSQKPAAISQGTTIVATNLFTNVPVRRQMFNSVKKKKEELKKIEDLLYIYGIIKHDVRISLHNNKDLVWQKPSFPDLRSALSAVFGRICAVQLDSHQCESETTKVRIECCLPKPASAVTITSRSTNDRCFVVMNQRPVQLKDIEKVVREYYCHSVPCEGRHPVYYIHVTLPCKDVDVNVDPNKTKVMLHHQEEVISLLKSLLESVYGPVASDKHAKVSEKVFSSLDASGLSDSADLSSDFVNSFDSGDDKHKDSQAVRLGSRVISNNTAQHYDLTKSIGSKSELKQQRIPCENISALERNSVNIEYHRVNDSSADKENIKQDALEALDEFLGTNHGYDKSKDTHGRSQVHETDLHKNMNCTNADRTTCNEVHTVNHNEKKKIDDNCTMFNNEPEEVLNCFTQVENVTFDILDEDLEEILQTQAEGSLNGEILKCPGNSLNESDALLANMPLTASLSNRERYEAEPDRVESDMRVTEGVALNWSKGVSERNPTGETLQPVKLLSRLDQVGKKRQLCDIDSLGLVSPPAKKKAMDELSQPKLYDVIGDSPSNKNSIGYLAFSKEIRPKMVEEYPSADFDKISRLVRSQWEGLTAVERQDFELRGSKQLAELQKRVTAGRKLMQKTDRRMQPVQGLPSIKDQLLSSAGSKKCDVPVKSVMVTFSVEQLREKYASGLRCTQTQKSHKGGLTLVGPLKYYHSWVCYHGDQIELLNPSRLEETLLHRQLMESHVIPSTQLENPIGLNERSIGDAQLYATLKSLVPHQTTQTYTYIDDPRLKANGMEVKCHVDMDGSVAMELVAMATCMPMFGVKDLAEILELIQNTGAKTLYEARPLKVLFYLQGEAVRMMRQRGLHRTREDMEDLLEQMGRVLGQECTSCLHNKPFCTTVYSMANIPCSQLTQC
ncbi:PMS1 protein homolog 1-like isoform X2 [Dreissena polymorpha]|uniref:PMS1 protein homolog 1-like isoform X2 n=1 Tax=Dreissena polymorpha TaxID=45954 RepID=UPI002263C082|nr:PMS1 protein homolog 1-like isoform X2 [Dreissena polymorpha]XP_052250028.1 PMS1 protein homolog 1-like isoform X2 [Dreissena polymorpha]